MNYSGVEGPVLIKIRLHVKIAESRSEDIFIYNFLFIAVWGPISLCWAKYTTFVLKFSLITVLD